jgi:large subunit ribosomal protein L29
MKTSEIRDLDTATLLEQVEAKRQELFNLRIQWISGSLDNPHQLRIVRKDIARMLTVVRERELAATMIEGEGNA